MAHSGDKIIYFDEGLVDGITLPEHFTFPFFYEPHPLARIAAAELQHYISTLSDLDHNFGLDADKEGNPIGKMFGILVVQDARGKLGYLSAFSGKLAGTNDHSRFVPPVFDMLTQDSFFLRAVEVINTINARITIIEADEDYLRVKQDLERSSAQALQETAALKEQLKANKAQRNRSREQLKQLSPQEQAAAEASLVNESLYDKRQLRDLTHKWQTLIDGLRASSAQHEAELEALKAERKERSAALQQQLFEQYTFLNIQGESKSLHDIFSATAFGRPPAAAGECATPKLLQYAFARGYKPLAMAEFWWGASPRSEIRRHLQFYPACTGKCKPILAHMLDGMPVDENPFLNTPAEQSNIEIVYEDDSFVVVNKPAGLRSVPGVNIHDSVYARLQHALGGVEPLMVHRLDMDTSGLIIVAKTREAHRHIQRQFLQRTVKKRYTALLSKPLEQTEGEINLPLCPDPYNRPQQLVSFEHGKKSITKWKVVERNATTTKIHFWPLTGRTHQLRMHAAHKLGLNAPIVGDDLYGTPAERMYLHAAYLEFTHPVSKERVSFEVSEDF